MLSKMISTSNRSLIAFISALVLAVIHQYLFFGHLPGVSYPIFVILLYVYMFLGAQDQMRKRSWFGYLLFGVIIMLSMTYVLFSNSFFHVLNFVAIPPLIFIHITFMFSSRKRPWYKFRLIVDALDHLIPQSFRHFPTVFNVVRTSSISKMGDQRKVVLGKVMIGLAIALPLLIVVISLLSSADGAFGEMLFSAPDWMNNLALDEILIRGIWTGLFCFAFFGYLWGFIDSKIYVQVSEKPEVDRVGWKLDPIILVTVLIAINTVYVMFVVLQFSYLFGAWLGALPEGSSYAEYARSGFFELLAVTIINFVIMLGTLVYSGKEHSLLQKINNMMLYILVGCSGVMLYSAYTRLVLYEEVYGYTTIRFLVHAFMIFLALLLVIAGLRIHFHNIPLAKVYIVISLIAYVVVNYVGMDTIITEKNIERYHVSGAIDVDYLGSLSADAIPLLLELNKEKSGLIQEHLYERWLELSQQDRQWQSFNLSSYRAEKALEQLFRN
ncbi:DUF4153 domain-containing protein [Paenibacillus sp. IHBB 10380]|uniref:DUF4153 domain-containing protein n=1 Tax=Paenibacillus sp. IHBB 10380 TaxID=1566358 RepID=UPI0005CFA79F|nr:DUF4173 domain-containing protein [Paenibacillus sp. IHBB 10380]AJS60579.1 hypothetical protein UB51_21375 [Paenibacillus sp. IHBB 10380]